MEPSTRYTKQKLTEYGWPKEFRLDEWARDYDRICDEAWQAARDEPDPPLLGIQGPLASRPDDSGQGNFIANLFRSYINWGR